MRNDLFIFDELKEDFCHLKVYSSFNDGLDLDQVIGKLLPGLPQLHPHSRRFYPAEPLVLGPELPPALLLSNKVPARQSALVLEVLHGPDAGRQFQLHRGSFSLGKGDCQIKIQDDSLEPQQGRLEVSAEGITLCQQGEVQELKLNEDFFLGASLCRLRDLSAKIACSPTDYAPIALDLPTKAKTLQLALMVLLPLAIGVLIALLTGMWFFLLMSLASSVLMGLHWFSGRGESKEYRQLIEQGLVQDRTRADQAGHATYLPKKDFSTAPLVLGLGERKAHFESTRLKPKELKTLDNVPIYLPLADLGICTLTLSQGALRSVLIQALLSACPSICLSEKFVQLHQSLAQPLLIAESVAVKVPTANTADTSESIWFLAPGEDGVFKQAKRGTYFVVGSDLATALSISAESGTGTLACVGKQERIPGLLQDASLSFCANEVDTKTYLELLTDYVSAQAVTSGQEVKNTFSSYLNSLDGSLAERWSESFYRADIEALLGLTDGSWLNLSFLEHGPHFLLAGTTGSGKSQLLRSFVLSLAQNYAPQRLSLLLIDFKGGAGLGPLAQLPHAVGLLEDLDLAGVKRALRFLQADVRKREAAFKKAGVSSYTDYLELHRAENLVPDFPELLIVIDEFKMLVESMPEAMTDLMKIATIGRSLGIHLLLATQRPQGAVSSDIRANINSAICLRVSSAHESINVLGEDWAAQLPVSLPGTGFVNFGGGDFARFRAPLIDSSSFSGEHSPSLSMELVGTSLTWHSSTADGEKPLDGEDRVLSGWVGNVKEESQSWFDSGYSPMPAALPACVDSEKLPTENMGLSLGLAEYPEEGVQVPLRYHAADGPLLLVASPHERSSVLLALMQELNAKKTSAVLLGASQAVRTDFKVLDSTALQGNFGLEDTDFIMHLLESYRPQSACAFIFDGLDLWLDHLMRLPQYEQTLYDFIVRARELGILCLATSQQTIRGRFANLFSNLLLSADSVEKDQLRQLSKSYPNPSASHWAFEGEVLKTFAWTSVPEAVEVAVIAPHEKASYRRLDKDPQFLQLPLTCTVDSCEPATGNKKLVLGIDSAGRPASIDLPVATCTVVKGHRASGKSTLLQSLVELNPCYGFMRISCKPQHSAEDLGRILKQVPAPESTILLLDDIHQLPSASQDFLKTQFSRFRHTVLTFTPWAGWVKSPILSALSGTSRGILLQPRQATDLDFFTVFESLPKNLKTAGKLPPGRAVLIDNSAMATLQVPLPRASKTSAELPVPAGAG